MNILGLRPNPVHFARWLVSMDRLEVASDIMVRLLDGYRELRAAGDESALRCVSPILLRIFIPLISLYIS
jgi:hypothetical protein